MNNLLSILLIFGLLLFGCPQTEIGEDTTEYVCPDGSIVADSSECGTIEAADAETGGTGIEEAKSSTPDECPPGTEYRGVIYTYENGEQIVHIICADMDMVCPPCENCASGYMEKVITGTGEVCKECLFDSSCKEGFSCVQDKCVDITTQKEGSPCEKDSHCPEGLHCAPQDKCVSDSILDEFDSCGDASSASDCKDKFCEHCKSEHYMCPYSTGPINQKCVECFMDLSCKSGFVCESYRCVPE